MLIFGVISGFVGFAMIDIVAYHGRMIRMAIFLPISMLFKK